MQKNFGVVFFSNTPKMFLNVNIFKLLLGWRRYLLYHCLLPCVFFVFGQSFKSPFKCYKSFVRATFDLKLNLCCILKINKVAFSMDFEKIKILNLTEKS